MRAEADLRADLDADVPAHLAFRLDTVAEQGETILILAPVGRDSHHVQDLLERHGLSGTVCADLAELAARISDGTGAVLITEEAVGRSSDTGPLVEALAAQPDWSDVPFVFLFSRRQGGGREARAPGMSHLGERLPARVTNVMLLERPLGSESLVSALEWALASRRRQFVLRDQIEALRRQAMMLRANEEALAESRAYLRDLLDSAQEGFFAVDRHGHATMCNAAFRHMLGLSPQDEIVGLALPDIIRRTRGDGSPCLADDCPTTRTARDGTPCHVTDEYFHRGDGSAFPVEYRAQPVWREGELVGAVCTFSDLTERLRAESALRTADERFSLVLNSGAIIGSWIWDVPTNRFTADERFAQSFGLDPARLLIGMALEEVAEAIHPDDRAGVRDAINAALSNGGPYRAEYRLPDAAGGWRWVEANGIVSLDAAGRAERFPGVVLDVSERKRIEQALRASDRELRTIADSLPFLIAYIDRDLIYRFVNRAYQDWLHVPPSKVLGRHVSEIVGKKVFSERADAYRRALAGEAVTLEQSWPHRDGRRRDVEIHFMPRRDEQGAIAGFHVFVLDVTERALAQETLRDAAEALERRVAERTAALRAEIAERQRAEEALRQSQKMEAVGQLTGGIAHDFNNLLTGIIGSMDLMKRRIASGRFTDLERFMEASIASANRAAALTHRLLAFSRRQSLDARAIDVNALVGSLGELLARTIGEQVVLCVRLAPDLPLAHADANQLENALLNLAINARDAMPGGGRLLIETSSFAQDADETPTAGLVGDSLAAGCYVALSVTDTGLGMEPDVLARAFEPFYTTKPIGQGTGLGLSMIYGFARQSGGSVRIQSAPGQGTIVRLCMPVADAAARLTEVESVGREAKDGAILAPDAAAQESPGRLAPTGYGETVLVVEDDPSVRLLVLEVLSELGYAAIQSADANAAIAVLQSRRRIDLLVTDVGLPGMNGRQLAEFARQARPDLRVLFMTGYTANAAVRAGFLAKGMQMVTKPFALDVMATRIREMIES